ncbi:ABC-2 family transporter protein [Priestia aryabhattai]|uniref:ABC transporter permease n=1 Tax=Priestia aryabhattai TaxID=412384 RepID=UPI002E22E32A|nr:ABC-2 family transporter protein [Priestia aryabhattai]
MKLLGLKTFYRYLRIWRKIFRINLVNIMMYRANFLLNIVDSVLWFVITLLFFKSIYLYTDSIQGWDINSILLLVGTSELIKSLVFTLFIENLPYISKLVNKGELDGLLLKPVNSQFLVSLRRIDFGNLGNILPSLFLVIYALTKLDIVVDFNFFLYLILIIFSTILAYSIWMSVMTLSIWFTKVEGLHELFLGAMTLTRYPSSIFKGVGRLIFLFIIPIVLVGNVPASILLNIPQQINVLLFISLTTMYFLFSVFFWRFALKFYNSASA